MDNTITDSLITWYKMNHRILPWRQTQDPYKIWISEIILQQTRVNQGINYYYRFIETFPTIETLATASQQEVMRLWQGLGYYSRARNLMVAAQQIMTNHQGIFPNEYNLILKLKGIGPYTAAAIASFAFDLPYAAIDGNVYRILARLFNCDIPINSSDGKNYFSELAQSLLDTKQPNLFNQATMELGATVCTPKNPTCNQCPWESRCLANQQNRITHLPVKLGKTKLRDRYFNYLHIQWNNHTLITQRTDKDIWEGLYQFPLVETKTAIELETLISSKLFQQIISKNNFQFTKQIKMSKHQLSHQTIHATFFHFRLNSSPNLTDNVTLIPDNELDTFPIPRLIERYLEQNQDDIFNL